MSSSVKAWMTECVDYWSSRVFEWDIGVDWSDATEHCWRCGSKRSLQRCHIVAKQFGGDDSPSNIVALCAECHDEAPDVTDPTEIWRWIKETRASFYGSLKAERALAICKSRGVNLQFFDRKRFDAACESVGLHLMQNGSGCRVKASSIAWAIEKACGTEAANG